MGRFQWLRKPKGYVAGKLMAIEVAMVGSDPKEVLCDESIKWEQMTQQ